MDQRLPSACIISPLIGVGMIRDGLWWQGLGMLAASPILVPIGLLWLPLMMYQYKQVLKESEHIEHEAITEFEQDSDVSTLDDADGIVAPENTVNDVDMDNMEEQPFEESVTEMSAGGDEEVVSPPPTPILDPHINRVSVLREVFESYGKKLE